MGADGASSEVLDCVEKLSGKVRCHRLPEKPQNTRIYRTVMIPLPADDPEWINTASYSERNEAARVFECLPTKESAHSLQVSCLLRTAGPLQVHRCKCRIHARCRGCSDAQQMQLHAESALRVASTRASRSRGGLRLSLLSACIHLWQAPFCAAWPALSHVNDRTRSYAPANARLRMRACTPSRHAACRQAGWPGAVPPGR